MPSNSQKSSRSQLLGTLIGLISLLGILLYFTGWIYRWAYFGFFELEITTLNLSLESFMLVPIQVLFGDLWIFCKAVLALVVTVVLIKFTLWLLSEQVDNCNISRSPLSQFARKLHEFWLFKKLRSFDNETANYLLHDIVIIGWILFVLFRVASWQGTFDARRDAVNQTSTRPIVTLVGSSDSIALGRNLDNLLTNPPLKGYRIIGDVKQFKDIFGRETNDITNPKQPIVWRLLIENNDWVYLFPALSSKATVNQRPLVLAVHTGDGRVQLLILSRPKAT